MNKSKLTIAIHLSLLASLPALAQDDLRNVFPEARPPAVSPALPQEDDSRAEARAPNLPGQPGEQRVLDNLRGLIIAPALDAAPEARGKGVDVSTHPLGDAELAAKLHGFIGQAASLESLQRAADIVRAHLRAKGYPFTLVYLPEQEVVASSVVLIADTAKLDGDIQVSGANWFDDYREVLPAQADAEAIDAVGLNAGVNFLNRNPFRDTQILAEPGAAPGTTKLTLEARERYPLRAFAGIDNTGSESTERERLFVGADWGNPFGTADLMTYQFKSDPGFQYSRSHSLSYTHFDRNNADITGYAAYASSTPKIPAPFVSDNTSWQVGVRKRLPLDSAAANMRHELNLGADFKAADETLSFGGELVEDTTTHVIQGLLGYRAQFIKQNAAVSADLYFSPGGLSDNNDDAAFDAARNGTQARYAYLQLRADHQRMLNDKLLANISLAAQVSSAKLLGSEQFAGGGNAAVRAYPEDEVYSDNAVLLSANLAWTGLSVLAGDRLTPFGFIDAAHLRNTDRLPGEASFDLVGAGVGFDYLFKRYASARFSLGFALSDGLRTEAGETTALFSITVAY
jgi:hemolysin activation/secretion protein